MAFDDNHFGYLRDLFHDRTGIRLKADSRDFIATRLKSITSDGGFDDVGALVGQLKKSPESDLHHQVVEAIIENETSFFRDFPAFKFLRHDVGAALAQNSPPSDAINMWCAACSSGQEAYSVAIMVKDAMPKIRGRTVNIIASDVSTSLIELAQGGSYTQDQVNRGLPASLLIKHFTRDSLTWYVKDYLKDMLDFRVKNLLESWDELPVFDVILLRNVLIYFPLEAQHKILERLRKHMHQDSFLFLGIAEVPPPDDKVFQQVGENEVGCYTLKSPEELLAAGNLSITPTDDEPESPEEKPATKKKKKKKASQEAAVPTPPQAPDDSSELFQAYELLGLPPGASRAEVDQAFEAKTGQYDPIQIAALPQEMRDFAYKKVGELYLSYTLLKKWS